MNAHVSSEVLVYLGVIGVLRFASLAFCAHQLRSFAPNLLPAVTAVRLRKRMAGPAVRHASLFTVASAMTLLAGVILGM